MPYIPIKSVGFIYFMRLPGFEPGLEAISRLLVKLLLAKGCWEAPVITAGPQPHFDIVDFLFFVQSS